MVRLQNNSGILYKRRATVGIVEKIHNGFLQFRRRTDLDRAVFCDECPGQRREVFHVRTKYDWLPSDNRFHRILTAMRGQAFAHEHNCGNAVPISKFAG